MKGFKNGIAITTKLKLAWKIVVIAVFKSL